MTVVQIHFINQPPWWNRLSTVGLPLLVFRMVFNEMTDVLSLVVFQYCFGEINNNDWYFHCYHNTQSNLIFFNREYFGTDYVTIGTKTVYVYCAMTCSY